MICYHESDTVVDNPKILQAHRPLDFGGGFYLIRSELQITSWAVKVVYANNSEYEFLNKYFFDFEIAKAELEVICFQILTFTYACECQRSFFISNISLSFLI